MNWVVVSSDGLLMPMMNCAWRNNSDLIVVLRASCVCRANKG